VPGYRIIGVRRAESKRNLKDLLNDPASAFPVDTG